MSELSVLQAKKKTYKIGELELELKPLKLDDMGLFSIDQNSPLEEQTKASIKLITKTLKESVPDATDEEINNLGLQHVKTLIDAIMDVNGVTSGKNINDIIKARQTQAKTE